MQKIFKVISIIAEIIVVSQVPRSAYKHPAPLTNPAWLAGTDFALCLRILSNENHYIRVSFLKDVSQSNEGASAMIMEKGYRWNNL